MQRRIVRSLLCLAIGVVVSAGLVACGGGGTSSSAAPAGSETEASGPGSGNSGLAAIEAELEKVEKPPVPVELPPLSMRPPSGRTIAFITCPVAQCSVAEKAAKEATSVLGWNVETIQGGLTPETQADALKTAVESDPAGILAVTAVPAKILSPQLLEAEKAGVPVITMANAEGVGGGVVAAIGGNARDAKATAEAMANWVIVDSQGHANVVLFVDKNVSAVATTVEAAQSRLGKACPECTVSLQEFPFANVGTKFPGEVVSYLQKNPQVEYVILPAGATSTGVASAIEGAGLTMPKILTRTSSTENFANIENGLEAVAVPEELIGMAWRGVDAVARLEVGDSISGCCEEPLAQYQLLTKDTIKNPSEEWTVPALEQTFKKLWKVG